MASHYGHFLCQRLLFSFAVQRYLPPGCGASLNMFHTCRLNYFWLSHWYYVLGYWGIRYQTDTLSGCVGGTETIRKHIGIQDHKYHSCELWCKGGHGSRVARVSDHGWSCPVPLKTHRVLEITTRSHLAGLVWPEVANDDFQHNRCSRRLPFSVIYHKTTERNLSEPKEFHSAPMLGLKEDFWT
ncbi:hypothetical protein TNCV_3283961 [Trichonephila clavipes]|nr:hypothetical protein TNCV_3283961 [Trichonephila clavipes]